MQDRLDTRVRQINDRLNTEGCRYIQIRYRVLQIQGRFVKG
jgi:hypothetical protein